MVSQQPSSHDLHPKNGARFVFDQQGEVYVYSIYLADGSTLTGHLQWSCAGETELEHPQPEHWSAVEARKLARVITRSKPERLSRWRPEP